jgi:hypothetical protein
MRLLEHISALCDKGYSSGGDHFGSCSAAAWGADQKNCKPEKADNLKSAPMSEFIGLFLSIGGACQEF